MKKGMYFVLFASVCLLTAFSFITYVSADFSYGNGTSISRSYVGGELIKGNLEISFKNEQSASLLTSNFNGNIKLIDFLERNGMIEGQNYNCSFKSCTNAYKASATVSSLNLASQGRKSVGFKITGNNVEVTSLKLSLNSNAGNSCYNEISAEILGNESNKIQNYKYVNETCFDLRRGCYDPGIGSNEWPEVTTEPYCEKITLPASPAFQVGARIKNSTSGMDNIKMELYDSEWDLKGNCILPKNTQEIDEPKCIIEHSNSLENEYFICISAQNGNADYRINTEDSGEVCGNTGIGFDNYVIDYDIFAQGLKFASGAIIINESSYEQNHYDSLRYLIDNYIDEKYGRNCPESSGGCIIPIDILSNNAQSATFTNAEIKYNKLGANNFVKTDLYSLEKTNSTISSKYVSLDMEKSELSIPVSTSVKTLQLYLGGKAILPKTIGINVTPGFTYELEPRSILVGISTQLAVITSTNLSSIVWDFGDGTEKETTNVKKTYHRYTAEGEYTIEVEAIRKDGVSVKKTFKVFVGEPKLAAETLILKYEINIKNINLQLNSYPPLIKSEINNRLNLTELNISLTKIKQSIGNDTDYSQIVIKLLELNIPEAIIAKNSGKLPIEAGFSNLNVDAVEQMYFADATLTDYDKKIISQSLINWNIDEYNAEIEYKVIMKISSQTEELLFTYFKIIANSKNSSNGEVNLILNYPISNIIFAENYNEKEISSETGVQIAIPFSGSKTIEFILAEKIDISELGAYILPNINELGINKEDIGKIELNTRPKTALWLYLIIIFAFFTAYIVLQEWYKKRYESYLFRNKDELYNIINFIFNSRISGLKDSDIKKKLITYNWKFEQLAYAFKKIDGKRTGMWEIPIFKFIERRKVNVEIQKRQQQNIGAERFIKRPY